MGDNTAPVRAPERERYNFRGTLQSDIGRT
jgi:hypothetical protein